MWYKNPSIPNGARATRTGNKDGNRAMVFEWSKTPEWLQVQMKTATYLGGGYSSHVWDLHNGYVVKVTTDQSVLDMSKDLAGRPVEGLARTWAVLDKCVKVLGFTRNRRFHALPVTSKTYSVVIQSKYAPLSKRAWKNIAEIMDMNPIHGRDPHKVCKFGRDPWGFNAEGSLAQRHLTNYLTQLKTLPCPHRAQHTRTAVMAVRRFLKKNPRYAVDIDHGDNWGMNKAGYPVLLDPVV